MLCTLCISFSFLFFFFFFSLRLSSWEGFVSGRTISCLVFAQGRCLGWKNELCFAHDVDVVASSASIVL
jgi:hypothetical protein